MKLYFCPKCGQSLVEPIEYEETRGIRLPICPHCQCHAHIHGMPLIVLSAFLWYFGAMATTLFGVTFGFPCFLLGGMRLFRQAFTLYRHQPMTAEKTSKKEHE